MLPVSQLDVVNQALLELGELSVTAITDTAHSQILAAKINILFPMLLLETEWNFAIQYVSINTPLTTNYSPDYIWTYQLPSNYGRFFKWSTNCFPLAYTIIDGLLLANVKPAAFYYIVNSVDYDAISTLFYRALALYAAADCAAVLTQDKALVTYLQQKYEKQRSNAVLLNDMEREIQTAPNNDFDRQLYT